MRWPLVMLVTLTASVVSAQSPPGEEPSAAQLERARELFIEGSSAVDEGRWSDAVDSFTKSYELSGVPPALFNVGFALRALGRHVQAQEAFERLLARHRDDLAPAMLEQAEELLREQRRRVARLTVKGLEKETRYELRLDGIHIDDEGERPLRLRLNPGRHSFSAATEGVQPYQWEGELADGQRIQLWAELEPIPEEEGRSVFRHPVFWVVVGAAVIGGGVATGIVLQRNAQLEPMSDRRFSL
jgi:tetratricopeptide (TPR) repeat protein